MVAPSIRFDASKHHCGESSEDIDCQCHPQLSVETSRFNLISELGLPEIRSNEFRQEEGESRCFNYSSQVL
jgi:hypothetical protein